MEVVVVSPNGNPTTTDHFDFNRARIISPYISAPSSPKRFGEGYYYTSAPTSPTRFSDVCSADFDYFSPLFPPPITLHDREDKSNGGFAFSVGDGSEESYSRTAEELFHGGKIKPLKKQEEWIMESSRSRLLSREHPRSNSPDSTVERGKKKVICESSGSSQKKKLESDHEPSSVDSGERSSRGRERTGSAGGGSLISYSKSGRRVTRSLSPLRVLESIWDEELQQPPPQQNNNKESASIILSSTSSSSSWKIGSKKWKLRDLFLFRSASEGRGSSKDPFKKYTAMFRKSEEGKVSSFRSTTSTEMMHSIPKPRRKEPVSAHELHYARKKAEAEDLKKRTFLPYKQGILGRLAGLRSSSK